MLPIENEERRARTFKTAWFAKAARKALIDDLELCEAIEQVRKGQAEDLGGGVFKKRLDKNRRRSIIVAKRPTILGICLLVRKEGSREYY